MKVHEIRERLGEIYERLDAIEKAAEERNESLTTEELKESENLRDEYNRLEATLKHKEQIRAINLKHQSGQSTGQGEQREVTTIRNMFNIGKIVAAQLPNSSVRLDGPELEMHQEATRELSALGHTPKGIALPSFLIAPVIDTRSDKMKNWMDKHKIQVEQRDHTATGGTDGDQGGVTIQTDVQQIIGQFWPKTKLEMLGATMLTGLTSNLSFPRQTAKPTASFKTENAALSETSVTFEDVLFQPHRCGAYMEHSRQLLIQSAQNPTIASWLTNQLNRAMKQAIEDAGINGTGVAPEPEGILANSGISTVAIGTNGGAITWAHVTEFEKTLAESDGDFGAMAYLTTPGVKDKLKNTLKNANSSLHVWDTIPFGTTSYGSGDGTMNGYLAAITNNMPSDLTKGSGTDLHAMIFANWNEMLIGQWGGMDIQVNPYIKDIEGLVRITVDTFWDIFLYHPESFVACVDIDLTA